MFSQQGTGRQGNTTSAWIVLPEPMATRCCVACGNDVKLGYWLPGEYRKPTPQIYIRTGRLHLIVDGFGADPRTLGDSDLLYGFLDTCPDEIRMTKVAPPQVYTYHGKRPEDWGLSGFVLIAESHISVHTFPDRGRVNVDIFSCKQFDPDAALAFVKDTFGLSRTKVWTLDRGLEHLNTREAYHGMVRERVGLLPSTGERDA